ncbi:TRAP-T-associated universal stress protein TeaD [bacterium HR30]|nr:TRAP-T-associated universal stress protein TeaD [bacterium HR30]
MGPGVPKRILVASDFSPIAQRALAYARALARKFDATIVLLHAVPPVLQVEGIDAAAVAREAEAWARQQAEKIKGEPAKTIIMHGPPVECIVREARKQRVDLIVLGSRGLSGWKKWLLGSVTERVLQSAPCPVLVVSKSVRIPRQARQTSRKPVSRS